MGKRVIIVCDLCDQPVDPVDPPMKLILKIDGKTTLAGDVCNQCVEASIIGHLPGVRK